jgi:hypothetical protein
MDVKIYMNSDSAQIDLISENLIGRIDDEGNVYEVEGEEEICLGWIDFEHGDVFDDEDVLIGWVEDDGKVVAVDEEADEEIEIGYVNDQGALYAYEGEAEEALVGQLQNMQDLAEGAAALLFFLDIEEGEE